MEMIYRYNKVRMDSDMHGISNWIKTVDKEYYIMHDLNTGRYEIHCDRYRPITLVMTLPFDALDARTIEYVRMSMSKTASETLDEIDRHNEKLVNDHNKRIQDEMTCRMQDAVNYVKNKAAVEHIPYDAFKTRFI